MTVHFTLILHFKNIQCRDRFYIDLYFIILISVLRVWGHWRNKKVTHIAAQAHIIIENKAIISLPLICSVLKAHLKRKKKEKKN